jgi:hypothetical protein
MTDKEALNLAKKCGATTYTNRHYPDATAVTFSPLAWENFCEQALAAPTVQEPLFADIIAKHSGLAEELKAMDAAPELKDLLCSKKI